ncbi:MAG TPA: hypothetical protein VK826_01855 [Bacteroidia bacterium]|nr:hypothetical protein [Bacteroidia bacterium]
MGLAFLDYVLLEDYLTTQADLKKATLIIDRMNYISYVEERWLKDKVHEQFDISIQGQPYIVRLTDGFHSYNWDEILNKYSSGDTLEILYAPGLFQDTILANPHELKINGQAIIAWSDTKRVTLYLLLGTTAATLLFGFVSVLAYSTYKKHLLFGDTIIYHTSKWKLIKRWLGG